MKSWEHYDLIVKQFLDIYSSEHGVTCATPPEQLATAIGNDRAALEARLWSTAAMLRPELKTNMRRAVFDPAARTLTGKGIRLSYRIRRDPNAPVEYRNQQTSWGYVAIEFIEKPRQDVETA